MINHELCHPAGHVTSAEGTELQQLSPDGQLACNACRRRIFYCVTTEGYHHAVDPEVGCFLIGAEGV